MTPGGCCCACLSGLVAVGLLWVTLGRLVLVQYMVHREDRILCVSNRQQLLRLEEQYRRQTVGHRYATTLEELRGYAGQVGGRLWNGLFRCPAGGRYRVELSGSRVTVTCSVLDHPAVTSGSR